MGSYKSRTKLFNPTEKPVYRLEHTCYLSITMKRRKMNQSGVNLSASGAVIRVVKVGLAPITIQVGLAHFQDLLTNLFYII